MTLTDADLRDVLAQRASAAPADNSLARVAAVDHRVRVIRRRRAASASLAVVILLLVVTGVSGLFRNPHHKAAPVPAYLQKVAGGLLPRYNGGAEATSYATFRTDEKRQTTFTFTPTSWDFLVATSCDQDMPTSQVVNFEINGKPFMSGSCSVGFTSAGSSLGEERSRGAEFGIRLGEPATMHVVVARSGDVTRTWTLGPEKLPVYRGAMRNYRVAVAVYSPMPVADYPFPPRPHKLLSLDDSAIDNGGRLLGAVDARSVGPRGHGEVTTTLTPKGVEVDVHAVAPGAVTVTIGGTTVETASSWTWTGEANGGRLLTPHELRKLGVDVKAGDRITVGITGLRFTDPAWVAQVRVGR